MEIEVVCFTASRARFAVEASQVRTMLAADQDGGDAVPIEGLIGLPVSAGELRHRLILKAGGPCVEVSGPVSLETLAAAQIHPLPRLVAARMSLAGVRALALPPSGPVLILDVNMVIGGAAGTARMPPTV